MKVLKFGGTSVGTVASLQSVKSIVEAEETPVIIVVSALGGITDMLISTAKAAAAGNITDYTDIFAKIKQRHYDVITGMVSENIQSTVRERADEMLDELANIFKGVSLLKDLSLRSLDIIVSYGERLSSMIISNIIKSATLFDSRSFIKTTDQFGKHVLDPVTNELVAKTFSPAEFKVAVVPGFISSDNATEDVTNLGRGGSDYTAAIIAATLDAEVLEIWTDVDGFMTADPRVISNTYVIDHLTFVEAMELCNFGAKVVYPPTIYPVFHKNIPILIKNTFNPAAPGTLISATRETEEARCDGKAIKGISSISDTCLITVSGLGMVGIVGVNARIFNALAKEGISVFLVSQASSENTTSFAIKNEDASDAVKALEKEFFQELHSGEINPIHAEHNLATVAIV
ncbi:MAG: aspartate kinase, partial [Paramuribaculum sp.]|nr:aspartate kinase [Paramuribaculum sp.]